MGEGRDNPGIGMARAKIQGREEESVLGGTPSGSCWLGTQMSGRDGSICDKKCTPATLNPV